MTLLLGGPGDRRRLYKTLCRGFRTGRTNRPSLATGPAVQREWYGDPLVRSSCSQSGPRHVHTMSHACAHNVTHLFCMQTHIHIHTYEHTHLYIHTYTSTHTSTHLTHTHTNTQTHLHTHAHTCTHNTA